MHVVNKLHTNKKAAYHMFDFVSQQKILIIIYHATHSGDNTNKTWGWTLHCWWWTFRSWTNEVSKSRAKKGKWTILQGKLSFDRSIYFSIIYCFSRCGKLSCCPEKYWIYWSWKASMWSAQLELVKPMLSPYRNLWMLSLSHVNFKYIFLWKYTIYNLSNQLICNKMYTNYIYNNYNFEDIDPKGRNQLYNKLKCTIHNMEFKLDIFYTWIHY